LRFFLLAIWTGESRCFTTSWWFVESTEAKNALNAAIELTKALSAELDVVTILEPLPIYSSFSTLAAPVIDWSDEQRSRCIGLQIEARQHAQDAGIIFRTELVSGDEVSSIIECAKKYQADLLVLGMRKHRLLVGRTTHDIAEHSPCPLLGVR
jgi:nucleotide-binding universal stress UspA family protein